MEILEVSPFPYENFSGVMEHVRCISQRLSWKHDVTVYAADPKPSLRHRMIGRVRVETFKCYAPSDAYFISAEMLLQLRRSEFDIVQGHFYHSFPLHFAALAKCARFIVTPHFHGAGHSAARNCMIRLLKPFGKRTLEKAFKIVAVSEYEKSIILQQFGFDSSKVVVIPNGVNLHLFSGLNKHCGDCKSILYVGCLREYKGVRFLVDVLPKLGKSVVLEIVGKGPLRSSLESRARKLGIHHRIKFYEDLSRRDLLQKYVDADVFVLLSRYEAYSLVVAESLVAGTPCIVSKTSALSEWVDNETCFGIGSPVNLNELSRLIQHVIEKGSVKKLANKWIGTKILDWGDATRRLEEIFLS